MSDEHLQFLSSVIKVAIDEHSKVRPLNVLLECFALILLFCCGLCLKSFIFPTNNAINNFAIILKPCVHRPHGKQYNFQLFS